jgi:hypothetical protein
VLASAVAQQHQGAAAGGTGFRPTFVQLAVLLGADEQEILGAVSQVLTT